MSHMQLTILISLGAGAFIILLKYVVPTDPIFFVCGWLSALTASVLKSYDEE